MKMPRLRTAALLGALAYLLVPALAFAQAQAVNADSFQPTDKDMTRWIIGSIFGNWSNGSMVPMLGPAMQVLNLFALAFGTLMFTYVAVVGTLNTAQDGELLGRKWSSMWIPLRFSIGTSLLVPLSSGYSTIQHAILWLALAGGGAASQVWGAAVNNFAGNSGVALAQSPDYDARVQGIMRDILKSELCVAANGIQAQDAGTGGMFGMTETTGNVPLGAGAGAGPYARAFAWGGTNEESTKPADYCGTAKTSSAPQFVATDFNLATSDMSPGDGYQDPGLSNADSDAANRARAMVNAEAQGIMVAAVDLRKLAQRMANPQTASQVTNAEIIAAIKSASTTYRSVVAPAMSGLATGLSQDLTRFVDNSKDAGWIMAGSTFFQMAQIRSAAASVQEALPTVTPSGSKGELGIPGPVEQSLALDITAMDAAVDANFKGDSSDWWNPGDKFAMAIGEFMSFDPSSKKHALVQIKDTGDRIIVATEGIASGMLAATTVALEAKNNFAGRVVDALGGVGTTLLELFHIALPAIYIGFITCFGVGITMAFVIPMLPFTLTVGSIVGWLMAVFSAVVAGPVWLAGHLHPEGDDIAGKGVGGYMILLETVTRPIFIVFGLIGAFLVMDPVLKLVAILFKAGMYSLQGNSFTGIVSVVVLASVYVGIVFSTVRSTMSLTHVLSETVYRWIGGSHAGMEQAREFAADAGSNASASTRGVQGAGTAAATARRGRFSAAQKAREAARAANDKDPEPAALDSSRHF